MTSAGKEDDECRVGTESGVSRCAGRLEMRFQLVEGVTIVCDETVVAPEVMAAIFAEDMILALATGRETLGAATAFGTVGAGGCLHGTS
ncbi:hypothetical protein Csal_0843 [Chromohalobacter israelensis DSM 3043]|uniref:Uncharacterized protein n=1 Tax=Chromohalobacter israelensis (strain ATCC BAA-138 / DSM 3043 / CIP 106854 / NCIMB 13768 / 1H11) TaxID=290398 RepID=Q1QZA8_CHRI1|nr:hypothetical protein Csal_0843 [Chromohalobacter salexigens DSM 3043]